MNNAVVFARIPSDHNAGSPMPGRVVYFPIDEQLHMRHDAGNPFRRDHCIAGDADAVQVLLMEIEHVLTVFEFAPSEICAIKTAIEGLLVSAIKHRKHTDLDKGVRVHYRVIPERLDFRIADRAAGFDASETLKPAATEELGRPHDRALMMRSFMNELFKASLPCAVAYIDP